MFNINSFDEEMEEIFKIPPEYYDIIDMSSIMNMPDYIKGASIIHNQEDVVMETLMSPVIEKCVLDFNHTSFMRPGKVYCQFNYDGKGSMVIQMEERGMIIGGVDFKIVSSALRAIPFYYDTPHNFPGTNLSIHSRSQYCERASYCQTIAFIAIVANYMMKQRPETILVVTPNHNMNSEPSHNSYEKPSHPTNTKIQRIIRMTNEPQPVEETAHTTHTIHCPCWGVAGHYRRYKNGKEVWVKPHLKGPMKDCPSEAIYSVKKYQY